MLKYDMITTKMKILTLFLRKHRCKKPTLHYCSVGVLWLRSIIVCKQQFIFFNVMKSLLKSKTEAKAAISKRRRVVAFPARYATA